MDIATILAIVGGGAAGGVGGSSLLMFILKSHKEEIDKNERRINRFIYTNTIAHGEIYKRIEEEEDCMEKELADLNKSVTKLLTFIAVESDNPKAADILGVK